MHAHRSFSRNPSTSRTARPSLRSLCAVAVIAMTVPAAEAEAQIAVIDPAAIAQLVRQVRQQVQQILVMRQQLQLQIANMRKLSNPQWRSITGTLRQIDGLTQQGLALWYSLAALSTQVRQTFPGWQLSTTMPNDIRVQQERTLATIRSAVEMANLTYQQLAVATAKLAAMKGQLSSITSAQAAAELTGSIGIHTAEEITLLRQQLVAQGNAQAVFLAHQVNRESQGAAAADAFRLAGATTPVRPANMTVAVVGIP